VRCLARGGLVAAKTVLANGHGVVALAHGEYETAA